MLRGFCEAWVYWRLLHSARLIGAARNTNAATVWESMATPPYVPGVNFHFPAAPTAAPALHTAKRASGGEEIRKRCLAHPVCYKDFVKIMFINSFILRIFFPLSAVCV